MCFLYEAITIRTMKMKKKIIKNAVEIFVCYKALNLLQNLQDIIIFPFSLKFTVVPNCLLNSNILALIN